MLWAAVLANSFLLSKTKKKEKYAAFIKQRGNGWFYSLLEIHVLFHVCTKKSCTSIEVNVSEHL